MKLTCPDCGDTKPSLEFYKDKSKASGYQSYCKPCARIRSAERFRRRVGAKSEYIPRDAPRTKPMRACGECWQDFEVKHPGAVYCSRDCSSKASGRQARGSGKDPRHQAGQQSVMDFCDWCGAMFESHLPHTKRCSPECRSARHADLRAGNPARRARRYGVQYVHVQRHIIFDRDGWICALCGDPIDPEVRYPDRMSASIDHIVPISRGGDHLPGNLQASHWICNVRKGAREQAEDAGALGIDDASAVRAP